MQHEKPKRTGCGEIMSPCWLPLWVGCERGPRPMPGVRGPPGPARELVPEMGTC